MDSISPGGQKIGYHAAEALKPSSNHKTKLASLVAG
eukprot:CAMPEP_0119020612 /NCGR_PEP_ID=MMETSP1176-20130426/24410_1 /TAXON_ID=265551 /ORGANISM="Synedropsis recta cf, Strain CCMP1620" /LENGTH=35 /DNA_ID= /DNA_START= /DNA_END= /DNA_ORIENTATION=